MEDEVMIDVTSVVLGLMTLLGGCGWFIDRRKHRQEIVPVVLIFFLQAQMTMMTMGLPFRCRSR